MWAASAQLAVGADYSVVDGPEAGCGEGGEHGRVGGHVGGHREEGRVPPDACGAGFDLLAAIDGWPEFNLFTAGYTMSRQPADSERYKQALEWQWETLDVCVGEKINRADPGYAKYMSLATTEGRKRVCWNSWIAPHNFEGFFLNMGDMLVKAGDWQAAQKIYANAELSQPLQLREQLPPTHRKEKRI